MSNTFLFGRFLVVAILVFSAVNCTDRIENKPIDRLKVVTRHNIHLDKIDTLGSLSVGNGEFAYTADITGMQTFPQYYENGVSLGTQSQWGWHIIPSDSNYTFNDVANYYESCNDQSVPYAIQHKTGRPANAANWLRANPHRLHLGIVGLSIINHHGEEIAVEDVENPNQHLNLWTGKIDSYFEFEGFPVHVETVAHQELDMVSFKITSPLISTDLLKIKLRFPYGKDCHVCPGYDWENQDKHRSEIINQKANSALIQRNLDSTQYFVHMNWDETADIIRKESHYYVIDPSNEDDTFEYSIAFSPEIQNTINATYESTFTNSQENWEVFWKSGGAIDFENCTDPRATELERRVILSQYLMKIQCAGSLPPQETGLTFNSWYGKFHLEMHWWHAVHFALWGRPEYLEKSMSWYFENVENARITAIRQGYAGVRWQKMTSPNGLSSPSNVGEFLVWQQPHIIYFAELLYRSNPTMETLNKYKNLVYETADFMASFAQYNQQDGYYHLCPPLIPAQEHFVATETSDPAFELSYWDWGLQTAQKWHERLNEGKNETWQKVIDHLAPIPENDTHYLPTKEAIDAFTNFEKRRDHPIVVGSYGFLPNKRINNAKMSNTFNEVMQEWNWQSTWGWDYPLLAMTAARLYDPNAAIDALMIETQKNTYLINGHNFQNDRLRIYLPGNGGLLAAIAMMAAGFEGSSIKNPGFPIDGTWDIKWEGLEPML